MNTLNRLMVLPALVAVGCSTEPALDDSPTVNRWMISTMYKNSVENGIISDHTIYAYHFETGSEQLTELGKERVRVLGNHYSAVDYSGTLNIRRGGASTELYDARKEVVVARLTTIGVDVARMSIEDGKAGGDGADSRRVREDLAAERETRSIESTGDSSESRSSESEAKQ